VTVSIDELIAGCAAVLTFVATLPLLRTVWQRSANPGTHPLSRHALLAASTALWLVYGIRNGVFAPAAMCGLSFVLHVLICLQVSSQGRRQGKHRGERPSAVNVAERERPGAGRADVCRCPSGESGSCSCAARPAETTTESRSRLDERRALTGDEVGSSETPGPGRGDA